jgi:N-acetylmuramoyl-L-alanine amidase
VETKSAACFRATGIALVSAFLLTGAVSAFPQAGGARLSISNRLSPLNRKRPIRPETRYIILHTTEGAEQGSLRKVQRYGETHYFVTLAGNVYRIIDRNRIATHTGRSMWEGKSNLDTCSIGIEVVGTYDHDITPAQYDALAELLRQLKSLYHIEDKDVLTHSMVAYGRPNQFHPSNHRGRKRCGMIFARPDVRRRLGLLAQPTEDPDVAAGRLRIGDPELQARLYPPLPVQTGALPATPSPVSGGSALPSSEAGDSEVIGPGQNAWSIARDEYNHPDTTYVLPNGRRLRGDEIEDWNRIPAGTRVLLSEEEPEQGFEGFLEIGKDGNSVRELAGDAFAGSTTIYFFPDGLIRTGAELSANASLRKMLDDPPKGTRLLTGYTYGGYVGARRSAYYVVGTRWNYPSTFYRLPDGRILSGDEIDENAIPARTLVFFQN